MRKWGAVESGLRLCYWRLRWYELLALVVLCLGICASWLYAEGPTYLLASLMMAIVLGSVCGRYAQELVLAFNRVPSHRERVVILLVSPILVAALPVAVVVWYSNGIEVSLGHLGLQLGLFILSLMMALDISLLRNVATLIFAFFIVSVFFEDTQSFPWKMGLLILVLSLSFLLWVSRSVRFIESLPERVQGRTDQPAKVSFSSSSSEIRAGLGGLLFESGGWPKMLLPFFLGASLVIGGFSVWFLLLRDQDTGSWASTLRYFGATFIEPSIGARIQTIVLVTCMSFWAVLGIPRRQTSLLYPFSRRTHARSTFAVSLSLSLSYFLGILSTFLLLFVGTQGLDFEGGRLVGFLLPILQVTVVMLVVLPLVQWFAVRRQGQMTGNSVYAFLTVFIVIGSIVFNLNLDAFAFAQFLGFCAILGVVSHWIYWQRLHAHFRRVDLVVE